MTNPLIKYKINLLGRVQEQQDIFVWYSPVKNQIVLSYLEDYSRHKEYGLIKVFIDQKTFQGVIFFLVGRFND